MTRVELLRQENRPEAPQAPWTAGERDRAAMQVLNVLALLVSHKLGGRTLSLLVLLVQQYTY